MNGRSGQPSDIIIALVAINLAYLLGTVLLATIFGESAPQLLSTPFTESAPMIVSAWVRVGLVVGVVNGVAVLWLVTSDAKDVAR